MANVGRNVGSKALDELYAAARALEKAGYELECDLGDDDELVAEEARLQSAVRIFKRKCEARA